METRTYNVWPYEEASDDLKEEILEKYRNFNVEDNYWHEYVIDMWKERLEAVGFQNAKIFFSGFWSQGDGAVFDAEINDMEVINAMIMCGDSTFTPRQWNRLLILAENDMMEYGVRGGSNHYVHPYTRNIETRDHTSGGYFKNGKAYPSKVQQEIETLGEAINEYRADLCHAIYKDLEKEFEWLTSNDQVAEGLINNEYMFNEKGEIDS